MAEIRNCPQCGGILPADAPEGLCAGCLMQQGLADEGQMETALSPGSLRAPDLQEIAEHFPQLEIQSFLGQGGMGAVYRARQKALDRVVALKILPTESAQDPAFAERFAREARAMARLHHSNIVTVFEFGESNGLFYLIMEYVDGVNLRQAIRSKQISAEQALSIVPQICDALQYAHEEGVVHRDIKPENILLDKRGRVKIADFGLAKLLRTGPVDVTLTVTRQVVGTLHYMAPEQIERPLQVDHRADIYSLGVVFYELLTGDLPVGRFKLPSEKAPIDARLDDVVLKTLEREPDARYQHASDLKTDVQTISSSPSPTANRPFYPTTAAGIEQPTHAGQKFNTTTDADDDGTKAPAIALIAVGALQMVGTLLPAVFGFLRLPFGRREIALHGFLTVSPLVVGLLMVIGGMCMLRRSSRGFALAGSIAAIFPMINPGWILTAPAGIWALIALNRSKWGKSPDDFQPIEPTPQKKITDADIEEGRKLVTAPGVGLIIVGIIDLAVVAGLLLLLLGRDVVRVALLTQTMAVETGDAYRNVPVWGVIILAIVSITQVPLALVLILGGTSMVRLRSRGLGIFASIAALLPFHLGCVLGFPVGVWALAMLLREDVRAAFEASRQTRLSGKFGHLSSSDVYSAPRPAKRSGIGIVFVILAILLVLALLLAALIVGVLWLMPIG